MSSAQSLAQEDSQLSVQQEFKDRHAKYSVAATEERLNKVKDALIGKAHEAQIVSTGAEALEAIKALIPEGSDVFNTGSLSLNQIGFIDYLKTANWNNIHGKALNESGGDHAKLLSLLLKGTSSDYVVSTVDVVTESGEFIVADGTGTRVGAIYAAGKVIYVVGANKVVADLDTAYDRVKNYTAQLEHARVRKVYGWPASSLSNVFAVNTGFIKGRIHFILVKETLGF